MQALIQKVLGFSIVGAICTLLSIALIWIFNDVLGWNVHVSYIIAYGGTIVLSYVLNALCVWKHRMQWMDVVRFFGIYLSSMLLGDGLIYLFQWILPNLNHTILSYCTLPFTFTWNYVFVNYIFKDNHEG